MKTINCSSAEQDPTGIFGTSYEAAERRKQWISLSENLLRSKRRKQWTSLSENLLRSQKRKQWTSLSENLLLDA